MSQRKEINNEIIQLADLKSLTETYQEIAAIRMQKIKNSVLKNREFLAHLQSIFMQVRTSYFYETKKLLSAKGRSSKKSMSLLTENDGTVSVLLSANTMLYGDIIRRTFDEFVKSASQNNEDMVVVGRVGKRLMEELEVNKKFDYFDFSDGGVDEANLKAILNKVKGYSVIKVFHGKFKTILSQIPEASYVRGTLDYGIEGNVERASYLFEPSLEQVLKFFENELLTSVFEQTVFESNLSKYASRMVSLDSAVDSIGNELKKAEFRKKRLEHSVFNRKQNESLSGIALW